MSYHDYENYATYRLAVHFLTQEARVFNAVKRWLTAKPLQAIEFLADELSRQCHAEVEDIKEDAYREIMHTTLTEVDWDRLATDAIKLYNRKTKKTPPPPPTNDYRNRHENS